ncbi:Pesticin receptor [Zhongshania aliphaticivorans]|nr:Pesticin receptor [Zhongshania aliphaticivorans]
MGGEGEASNLRRLPVQLVALLFFLSSVTYAQAAACIKIPFDIPRQSADQALIQFAEQAKVTFIFAFESAQGKTSKALRGEFSRYQAVQILLEGTGLYPEFRKDGVLAVTTNKLAKTDGNSSEEECDMVKNSNKTPLLTRLAAAIVATFSVSAGAQSADAQASSRPTALEEVIVTAQKRAQGLQDVPISISAFSGDKIKDAGIPDFEELSAYIPNFSVSENTIGDTISIRGINSDSQAGGEQSVGIYVDGIYRGRGVQSRFAFLDVGLIEVLRGPQGTLFGKNTIGGALNITSAKPTEEREASVALMHEFEHEETEIQAHFSGPISDSVRGRLALLQRTLDKGWVDNSYYNESTPNNDEWGGRLSLDWDVSDVLSTNFKFEHSEFDITGAPYEVFNVGGPSAATLRALGVEDNIDGKSKIGNSSPQLDIGSNHKMDGDSDELMFRADYAVSAGVWTALLGYSNYQFVRDQDVDYNPLDVLRARDSEEFEQKSVELRFASEAGGRFEYIAGLYWQEADLETGLDLTLNGPFASAALGAPIDLPWTTRRNFLDQQSDIFAAFAQGTWTLSDTVRLTAGLRYGKEEKTADQLASLFDPDTGAAITDPDVLNFYSVAVLEAVPHQFSLDRTEEDVSPSINVQWDATEQTMLYASVSKGFKGGGFNSIALSADPDEAEYENEEALAFELGSKTRFLNGAAELNVALFQVKFDDLQTTQFTGSTSYIVTNAASATTRGIEVDGRWQLSPEFRLQGSLGYVDFEFEDYRTAGCTAAQIADGGFANGAACSAAGTNDLSGRTNQDTPELTGSVSAIHIHDFGVFELTSQLDVNYSDEYYAAGDLDPNIIQDSFIKVNASVSIGPNNGKWDVALVARNLTDEQTFSYANDMPLFSGTHFGLVQRPRTFAIRGRLNF